MSKSFADELFEEVKAGQDPEYSFITESDHDNIESMRLFIEENDLEDYVIEDDGTLVYLEHPDYDFQVALNSYGLGDFYTHGIGASIVEGEDMIVLDPVEQNYAENEEARSAVERALSDPESAKSHSRDSV